MVSHFELLDNVIQEAIIEESVLADVDSLNAELMQGDDLILYLNIRSINANFGKLLILLEKLATKPFVIICVETWRVIHENFFSIPGYKMYYNDGDINQNDGVITYILDDVIETTEVMEMDRLKILNTCIKMKNGSSTEISALYRSHDMSKDEFIGSLKKYLLIKRYKKNHFIVGDFNIDLFEYNCLTEEYLNNFLEKGYMPGYQKVTHPIVGHKNGGTCIDNVFYKTEALLTKAYTITNSLTDHYTLMIKIKKQNLKKDPIRNIQTDFNRLRLNASDVNWSEIYSFGDPEMAVEFLIKSINHCVKKSRVVVGRSNKKRQAWITWALVKSCETKEKLYLATKSDPTNELLVSHYKLYSKILNRVIEEAKTRYEREYIAKNVDNKKKL